MHNSKFTMSMVILHSSNMCFVTFGFICNCRSTRLALSWFGLMIRIESLYRICVIIFVRSYRFSTRHSIVPIIRINCFNFQQTSRCESAVFFFSKMLITIRANVKDISHQNRHLNIVIIFHPYNFTANRQQIDRMNFFGSSWCYHFRSIDQMSPIVKRKVRLRRL